MSGALAPSVTAPLDDAHPAASEHLANRQAIDGPTAALIEEFAYRYGLDFDSYLCTDLNRHYFWSAGRQGLLSFVTFGRHLTVIGGLLAPPEQRDELVRQFVEFCQAGRHTATFFGVNPEHVPALKAHGFQVTKVGEETLIDLAQCTWKGKDFEWLRRQSNFCLRHGLVVREVLRSELTDDEWRATVAELNEVSRQFLKTKPQGKRMKYFISRFEPEKLLRQRMFVARAEGGTGRVEAFIVCNPARDGRLWSIETYRSRGDAVRGAVPFLMHQVLQLFQKEGVPLGSLCMVPFMRCDQPLEGDSWLARKFAVLGHKYASMFFDTQGIYHFKSRFRPRFEDRFLCVWPKTTVWTIRSNIELWGVDHINPFTTVWRLCQQFWKRKQRANLARPDDERE